MPRLCVRLSVPATGRRNDQRTPDGPRPYATRRRVATFREPRARLVDGVLCVRARRCPWSRGSGCARGSGAKLPTVRRRHCARRVFGPRGRPADVRGQQTSAAASAVVFDFATNPTRIRGGIGATRVKVLLWCGGGGYSLNHELSMTYGTPSYIFKCSYLYEFFPPGTRKYTIS